MFETVSEVIAAAALAAAVGLFGVLVSRRRKHLKLVVRVIDQKDMELINFLDGLVKSGELVPAKIG